MWWGIERLVEVAENVLSLEVCWKVGRNETLDALIQVGELLKGRVPPSLNVPFYHCLVALSCCCLFFLYFICSFSFWKSYRNVFSSLWCGFSAVDGSMKPLFVWSVAIVLAPVYECWHDRDFCYFWQRHGCARVLSFFLSQFYFLRKSAVNGEKQKKFCDWCDKGNHPLVTCPSSIPSHSASGTVILFRPLNVDSVL